MAYIHHGEREAVFGFRAVEECDFLSTPYPPATNRIDSKRFWIGVFELNVIFFLCRLIAA